MLFSGSADHQLAVDMTVHGEQGRTSFGIMTKSFVDAVKEMAECRDETYAGVEPWSYGQLFSRVKELVNQRAREALPDELLPENIERQEPQMSSSHPFDTAQTAFTM